MKNIYITDLKSGMSLFSEDLALKKFKKAITRNGKPYYDVEFGDKTGSIKGKIWSEAIPSVGNLIEGKVYSIDAGVSDDQFGLQLNITTATEVKDFNTEDFVPSSSYSIVKMQKEFETHRDSIKNKHLRQLVGSILKGDFYNKYLESPAAYYIHHAYKHGLLEHTLDMLKMSESVVARYPKINKDLLVTGIMFHDLGKVFEYSLSTSVSVTKKGKLLGHIFMGAEYVKTNAPKDTPEDLLDEVTHLILSHQGELEFGSPIKPKTAEAVALYYLDNTSTKINAAYNVIHSLEEGAEFAPYHKQLGVELYRSPYLDNLLNEDIPF